MSKGIELDCKFGFLGSGYTCKVQNESLITSIDDRVITGIRGEHLEGKSNDDVTRFYTDKKTINFFPQNLTKYFKNINSITINNGKLQKITKEDLKEFGDKLEYLNLYKNEIEVLEAGLFEFNRKLKNISLSYNKIKIIEAKTFDGLEKLKTLWLENNPCTSENDKAYENCQEVLELIKRVEANYIYSFIAEKFEKVFTFINSKTFEALNESNEKFESLKSENEKLNAKLSEEILLRNKENEDFKMESLKKIHEKETENLKLEEEVKRLKENEDLKAFMTEVIQGQEEKLKSFIEAQISSKLNLQATKISSLEEKMKDLTSKSTNEVKNLIEGQNERTKNAFDELKKDQKIFADAKAKTLKLNLDKITKDQREVKSLIESQTTKVSSLDGKFEKEIIKVSRDLEKSIHDFKINQENILKRINENLNDATLKFQNEVKNLIEGQISTFDTKIEIQVSKIIEDSKKALNKMKKDQQTFAENQGSSLKLNLDKITNEQTLMQSQTIKLSSHVEKIEKEVLNLSKDSENAFTDLKKINPEKLIKSIKEEINENLKNSIVNSQNEVKSLIEGRISSLDTKMNSLNDFILKFNEKIEDLQIKIAEDSKNVFDKLENGEKTLTDAQEKFHNKNVEKIDVDLKNYTEELQERFKEIKNLIESQNAANLSLQNEKEKNLNETLILAEKINENLSKILEDSEKVETLKNEYDKALNCFGHRISTMTSDLKSTAELYSSVLNTLQTYQNQQN